MDNVGQFLGFGESLLLTILSLYVLVLGSLPETNKDYKTELQIMGAIGSLLGFAGVFYFVQ